MPFMGGGLGPGGHPPDGLRRRRREAIEDHQVLEESVSTIVTDFRASVRSAAQAVRDAKIRPGAHRGREGFSPLQRREGPADPGG